MSAGTVRGRVQDTAQNGANGAEPPRAKNTEPSHTKNTEPTPASGNGPANGSGAESPSTNSAGSPRVNGLGGAIRQLRLTRGLTQREVAAPRYTRAFLAAIEAGIRTPSETALRHIAGRLDAEVEDLLFGRPPGISAELHDRLATARRDLSHGDVEGTMRQAREVNSTAIQYGLTELICSARWLLGEAQLHRGEIRAANAEFDAAASLLPPDAPSALRAVVVARRAYGRFSAGDSAQAVAMLEGELRRLRAAPTLAPDAELRTISALLYVFVELDWRDRARQLESEAQVLLPKVTNREWLAQFYAMAAQLRQDDAELDDVERMLAQASSLYQELGLPREIGLCHWVRGYVLRRVGRLADAAAELRRALQTFEAIGAVQDRAGAALELAEALRQQGDLTGAARLGGEAARICLASQHTEGMAEADRLRGLVAGQTGDTKTAERLLRQAADRYEGAGMMADVVTTCRLLGELLLAQGRSDEAVTVFRRGLHGAEKIR